MSQEQVLVVDDEEVMRDVLGRVLGQAGYDVTFAETGLQGVELARRGSYAAAIVDVMLPEMGGLEVL
jgi:CheY-like chemotaxis protein